MTIAAMHAHLLRFPKHVWILLALYGAASSAHFAHNAAYIAFYPGIPAWLTAEKVHAGWIGVSSIGVLGLAFAAIGWRAAALLLLALYGASGLDGLGHYQLALCSQHTLAMNLTIWAEALCGAALAVCAGRSARAAGGG